MSMSQLDAETTTILAKLDADKALRPDEPSLPVGEWMGKNLFGMGQGSPWAVVRSTLLTVLFGLLALFSYRGFLNFVFSEERRWDAVRTNLRLLFTQAYPDENYTRVWVTVAIVAALAGLSLGLMKVGRGLSMKRIATWCFAWGGLIVVGILLREASALTNADGSIQLDVDKQPIREGFIDKLGERGTWWVLGLVLLVIGSVIWFTLGDLRRRTTFVPAIPFGLVTLGLFISSVWWFNWGNYTFTDDGFTFDPGNKVAGSTQMPWTLIFVVLLVAYLIGQFLLRSERAGTFRGVVNGLWLLAPFVTFWVVLRGPVIDWSHVLSTHLPMALGFIVLGGALLWFLTQPGIGEKGRIIAVALILFALFNWLAAFMGWYPMLQKARLSFLFLGLAAAIAPNFIGDAKQRLKLIYGWVGFMTIFHILVTIINTPSSVEVPTEDFAGGFMITVYVAVFTMIFSFPLGVVLALARTSRLPLFRMLSTVYIEVIRGVPLITLLFFFSVFVNLFLPEGMELSGLAAVTVAFVLFSAAYLAENVRGGLQAIRRGQYEASDALGLTTVQRTMFIVLPQGLRVSIPPLVGQVIATFKETSLLAIVGVFDFLRIARDVIPAQTEFLGVKQENLLFISAVYFIVSYSMSKYSQRLEKQLGVGER